MLTRDEQSTIFGGAATILGINEMLNAQLRPASIMANAPLTERVATVAEAFEKVGPALKAYATYCAGYFGALATLTALRSERPEVEREIEKAEKELMSKARRRRRDRPSPEPIHTDPTPFLAKPFPRVSPRV